MAWDQLSLSRVLVLGLLAPLAAAKNSENKAGAEAGSDSLAYDEIQKVQIYTDNATAPVPPVEGWWDSKICSDDMVYCVYTNRRVAKGRGMVAVTKHDEFQKLDRLEEHVNRGENKYFEDPSSLTETEIPEKGRGIAATKPIRRAKPLLSWTPVLLVHKSLFDHVPKKKERTRLLETAVSYLPPQTRAQFDKQRRRPGDTAGLHPRSVEDILLAHPFEINLGMGYTAYNRPGEEEENHSKHYANYPEVSVLQHDCRPNVATHIDSAFALRATVARRVQPGEKLTISYVDPFLPKEERSEWVERHRSPQGATKGSGGCPCKACSATGEETEKGEKRLKQILADRAELRNHDSTKVDFELIERFLRNYEAERLHAKYEEAYELAALNFNYLGDDKRAKKYAELAVQAGIVEGGLESNDVVAMRIMAKDIKGHYSYRYTLKRREM